MAIKYEKYIETTEFCDNTHLEISVHYSKGGMNYFTGKSDSRGFYLSVTPIKKSNGFISRTLFTGIKVFLHPVNRYSEKQHNLAIEKSKDCEQKLIDQLKSSQKCA